MSGTCVQTRRQSAPVVVGRRHVIPVSDAAVAAAADRDTSRQQTAHVSARHQPELAPPHSTALLRVIRSTLRLCSFTHT